MRSWKLASFVLGAMSVATSACVLLLDTETEQCTVEGADCGGTFGDRICRSGICVAKVIAPAEAGTTDAAEVPECTLNADCVALKGGDTSYICVKASRKCVSLVNKELGCAPLTGALGTAQESDIIRDDNTIWFGEVIPVSGPFGRDKGGQYGIYSYYGSPIVLAWEEFNDRRTTNGLPAAKAGGAKRRIGIVQCDSAVDPINDVDALKGTRYLVDKLKVPAILNLHKEHTLRIGEVTTPAGVFLISPNEVDGFVATTAFNSPVDNTTRLAWRTIQNYDQVFEAMAAYVPVLQQKLRATGGPLAGGGDMKVLLLYSNDAFGKRGRDLVAGKLSFNNKSAEQNRPNNYDAVEYEADPNAEGAVFAYNNAKAKIAAMHPHVIIPIGHADIAVNVLVPAEEAWSESSYRPLYAANDGLLEATPETYGYTPSAGLSFRQRARFIGVYYKTDTNKAFIGAYNARFPETQTYDADIQGVAYDAFYLTALATAAIGDKEINGTNIAKGVERLLPLADPEKVVRGLGVSLNGIAPALDALGKGKNVDLEGCGGGLDFNVRTGEYSFQSGTLCYPSDGDAGVGFFQYTEAVFNPAADGGTWGTETAGLECP